MINTAGPQDTWDHTFGTGALTWEWWIRVDQKGIGPAGDIETPDWSVKLTGGAPGFDHEGYPPELTEGEVTVEVTHKAVMSAARKVLKDRPRYASAALIREARNLVFNVDEADFDAASGDELLQVVVFGDVVYG